MVLPCLGVTTKNNVEKNCAARQTEARSRCLSVLYRPIGAMVPEQDQFIVDRNKSYPQCESHWCSINEMFQENADKRYLFIVDI